MNLWVVRWNCLSTSDKSQKTLLLLLLLESAAVNIDEIVGYGDGCLGSIISLTVAVPLHHVPQLGP